MIASRAELSRWAKPPTKNSMGTENSKELLNVLANSQQRFSKLDGFDLVYPSSDFMFL